MKNRQTTARNLIIGFLALMACLAFFSRTINQIGAARIETSVPTAGHLSWTYVLEGVIKYAASADIYAAGAFQALDIHVKKGDTAAAGAALITFDMADLREKTQMLRQELEIFELENELARQNQKRAAQAAASNARAVFDARAKELSIARAAADTPFDEYDYARLIIAAESHLAREMTALAECETRLAEVQAQEVEVFDDVLYQRRLTEAQRTLERKNAEVLTAAAELEEANANKPKVYDGFTHQKAIDEAKKAWERAQADLYNAYNEYYFASNNLFDYNDENESESEGEKAALQASASAAVKRINTAQQAVEDAKAAYEAAVIDYERAQKKYYETAEETRKEIIAEAQRVYQNALYAQDDASRALDNALFDLERAKTTHYLEQEKISERAEKTARTDLQNAAQSVKDAQRSVSDIRADKARAKAKYEEAVKESVERAEDALQEAQKQLSRALDEAAAQDSPEVARLYEARKARITEELKKIEDLIANDAVLTAADNIFIEEVHLNKNGITSPGMLIITAYSETHGKHAVFTAAAEQTKHMLTRASVDITSRSQANTISKAQITEIAVSDADPAFRVLIADGSFASFAHGEPVSMRFSFASHRYDFVIPLEAVHGAGVNTYVFVVKTRQTSLGDEQYLQRVSVLIAEQDGRLAAIEKGLIYTDTVMVKSSAPVFAGDKVRVVEGIRE